MTIHLHRDLEALHSDLLSMSAMVESMIHKAIDSLSEPSLDQAIALASEDREIDAWDVRIEENCLKILALHQPVAVDLRRIASVLKMCAELERVADLAVHIAERSAGLEWGNDVLVPNKLKRMARMSTEMLHQAIDSYVELDPELAVSVCRRDDRIDDFNREIIDDLLATMKQNPEAVDAALNLFSISRHLERIADHATNIAEDVVYLVEGTIIRHRSRSERESLSFRDPD